MSTSEGGIEYLWLGQRGFAEVRELQESYAEQLRRGPRRPIILFCEHLPTFSAGRRTQAEDLLTLASIAKAQNFDFVQCDRGGQATYHGPGQLVIYPVLRLSDFGLGVRRFIELSLGSLREVVGRYGVSSFFTLDAPGLWVKQSSRESAAPGRKIAAVGLRIDRGISLHGMSLNVDCDLFPYSLFSPCGYSGEDVTSLQQESLTDVDNCLVISQKVFSSMAGQLSILKESGAGVQSHTGILQPR